MKPNTKTPSQTDQLVLGHALRALRISAAVTQEQLAERLGVDPTFIGRLERGQRGAHWRTIRRILTALQTSVSEFATQIEAAEQELQQ